MINKQLFISNATESFRKINSRTTFIVIHNYTNNFNEVATHSLCWHINYKNAVKRSFDIMKSFIPNMKFCIGKSYSVLDLKEAHLEWLDSLNDTLTLGEGNNPRATSAQSYDKVIDITGRILPGVKVHREQGLLHLTNLYRLNKVIHKKGQYPTRSIGRVALAKHDLKELTPLKRFGQFVLSVGRFDKLSVCGLTIKEQDIIRQWDKV